MKSSDPLETIFLIAIGLIFVGVVLFYLVPLSALAILAGVFILIRSYLRPPGKKKK